MMNRLILAAALLAVLPWTASAQVEKQVEVTKAYVPSVESAVKLAVEPDMTDTVKLRPEIDYSITPLSLRTTLATRPIRPATVTYWEFNRPLPFYLKVGAGYPLNSVLDFYAASQNPSTGYVVGFVNHRGRYADIRNDFGVKNTSWRMSNRVGAAAGKYFGRHILEGDVSYDNRIYHRYGLYADPANVPLSRPGARVVYGDAAVKLRFGDDFQDLSRLNFEVALHGDLFLGNPDAYDIEVTQQAGSLEADYRKVDRKMRQTTLGGSVKIARAFGRHRFSLDGGYEHLAGHKMLTDHKQQQIRAGVRYGFDGGVVGLEAGADYYHDKVKGAGAGNYVIPFLRMNFNLGTVGLKPFLEVDGGVYENSFRALARQNPYLADGLWQDKSSVDYNARFGVGGSLWRDRFTYRVFAGFSIRDNHLYWYTMADFAGAANPAAAVSGLFDAQTGRQTVTSINAELEYRPISELVFSLGLHGYLYNDKDNDLYGFTTEHKIRLKNGAPSFKSNIGIGYRGRKVSFGVSAQMQAERTWTSLASFLDLSQAAVGIDQSSKGMYAFTSPFAVDLRAHFDWKVSPRATLFAEGSNLLNRRLYEYAWYPEYGADFTLGVKLIF